MRSLMLTLPLVCAVPAGTAAAQQPGVREPVAATGMQRPAPRPLALRPPALGRPGTPQTRWGDRYRGRWYGGYRAPGGWSAYRRPVRGYVLPRYWVQPGFHIADFAGYGLGAPQPGYGWYRYYDDAVLVDQRGHVHDSVAGVEWDRDGRAYADFDEEYRDDYYADGDDGYREGDADVADRGPPPDVRYGERREIVQPLPGQRYAEREAYREDEVGGDPGRRTVTTHHHGDAPHPRTVTTAQGYVSGGYYYPPVTTTTITYGQPATTTTITEEYVTYRAPAKTRRAYRAARRHWKPKPRCVC